MEFYIFNLVFAFLPVGNVESNLKDDETYKISVWTPSAKQLGNPGGVSLFRF